MDFETLHLERRDGVAHIILDRERVANAMNLQMARELMMVAIQCDEDPKVRAVLIRARGKVFCAGGDLESFSEAGEGLPTLLKEMTTYLHSGISRLARMRAPVVAAVGGAAAGAGLGLVCAVDLAIAAASARFTMAYTRVGLTPDGSSSFYLPRMVGTRRALEMMMTNRVLSAQEALDWGLVNQVVPDERIPGAAEELAEKLAAGPTAAFGSVKRLVVDGAVDSLESQMEREARAIADAGRTADVREGIQAFFAKRAADFRGE
jgi:2-(1,2-epoxy-1,2-dihydrophenyl)acetyl-CoA isomerase